LNRNQGVQFAPELPVQFKPEWGVQFAPEYPDSWPASIDDSHTRKDWNWKHKYDLETMTKDMLEHLK
jgi:nucleoside-diphosphate-sugar epimerase